MATTNSLRDLIAQVAREEGLDPAYALAVAERESSFNPYAGGTGTIRGLYQFTRANRRKYGLSDNASPEDQTRAFARLTQDLRGEMATHLGRDPTPGELYTGHHFGGVRAARIASGAYAGYAPSDLFSPREMAGNPHFSRARTGGELSQSIVADIDRRMTKHGGAGQGTAGIDFAAFGQADEADEAPPSRDNPGKNLRPGAIDFAAFGQAEDAPKPSRSSVEPTALARPASPGWRPPPAGAGQLLKDLDDEMTVRQNAPDPNDAAFQSTVRQVQQPQAQRI